jgi:L-ascorbate metabolism protein UlaG (beta-lactamase superfamily)
MRVTFLDHSGFLVESDSAALLFDWWKGELPAIKPGVPLYVFASHVHPDHFDPRIFALDDGNREARFILGHDIKLSSRSLARWGISPETAGKCRNLRGGETLELSGVFVEALPSTDEGEAFLVTVDGRTVFHAGDLNWWHWEGEDKGWNRNMEVNFKKYVEALPGRTIDLAMLPLDPRLGEAGFWGPAYFLETAEIRRVLPMHQWGEFDFTRKFLEKHPAFTGRFLPVKETGQVFAL